MKKRFLAITLALALCIGLTIPVFAANDSPKYNVSVDDSGTIGEKDFILRHITEDFTFVGGMTSTYTRNEETEHYHAEDLIILAPESVITVSGLRTKADPTDWVNLYAWSDPDSDGIYDEQLFVTSGTKPTTTTMEQGPFVSKAGDTFGYADSLLLYESDNIDSDIDEEDRPATIKISADYLTKLFGKNTFVGIELLTRGENEEEGYFGFYRTGFINAYIPDNGKMTASPSATSVFDDVPADAYFAEAVAWAVKGGVTAGTSDTTFSPDQTCTTAQILAFLWRASGEPEPRTENPFTDVSSGDYYYKAALWAFEMGLVGEGTFNGNSPCTRSATVTYLWKLSDEPKTGSSTFTDVPKTADYAQAVAWAVSQKITAGTSDTTFSPADTCTRGQIVAFLYRYFAK